MEIDWNRLQSQYLDCIAPKKDRTSFDTLVMSNFQDTIGAEAPNSNEALQRIQASSASAIEHASVSVQWIVNRGGIALSDGMSDSKRNDRLAAEFTNARSIFLRASSIHPSPANEKQNWRRWTDPIAWLQKESDNWRRIGNPSGVEVIVQPEFHENRRIWIDVDILSQIMDDLFCNALDRARPGVPITVSLEHHPDSLDWIVFRVRVSLQAAANSYESATVKLSIPESENTQQYILANSLTELRFCRQLTQILEGQLDVAHSPDGIIYSLHIPAGSILSWLNGMTQLSSKEDLSGQHEVQAQWQLYDIRLAVTSLPKSLEAIELLDRSIQQLFTANDRIIQIEPHAYLLASKGSSIDRNELAVRLIREMKAMGDAPLLQVSDLSVTPLGSLQDVLGKIQRRIASSIPDSANSSLQVPELHFFEEGKPSNNLEPSPKKVVSKESDVRRLDPSHNQLKPTRTSFRNLHRTWRYQANANL